MPKDLRSINRLLKLGLLLMAAGVGLSLSPPDVRPDMTYDPILAQHLFVRSRPALVVDEGHWNRFTASELFAPLTKVASRDGFRVERHRSRFSHGSLAGIRVLVVAGARSVPSNLQSTALLTGLHLDAPAFQPSEIEAVKSWVNTGGGLLLAVGDEISTRQSLSLLESFGLRLVSTGPSGPHVYERRNDTLLPHPVTDGRAFDETALRILTYGGAEFSPPTGVQPFLAPAPGRAQGVAFEFGKGRVAIFSDPVCVTALARSADYNSERFGMSAPNTDNTDLVINTLRWLARAY